MSGPLRVRWGSRADAERLASSVEAVLGRAAPIRATADGCWVDIATSGTGTGEVVISNGPPDDAVTEALVVQLPAEEADPIDIARLLGPVARGRVPLEGLASLVDTYRSLQSVGTMLDAGAVGIDGAATALPDLFGALHADLARPDVLGLWGTSTTVDDGVHQVPAPLVPLVAGHAGGHADPQHADPQCCHAGLAHTYGYLLSPVPTPFGRKRHRWTSHEVARVLGLDGDWPLGRAGVLTNLTEVLCQVAPLSDNGLDDNGGAPGPRTSRRLQVLHQLEDHGVQSGERWRSRTRVLGTPPPGNGAPDGDELLLVYSVAASDGVERYITAFPVSRSFAVATTAQPKGRLRYNAVLGEPAP